MSKTTIDTIKAWLTPSLISLLGLFLWRDLSELRSDVKLLLSQSTADHARIIQLEQDVMLLKQQLFYKKEEEITYETLDKSNDKKTHAQPH